MLIKQGDGKVLKIINEDDILDIDEKKVAKVFILPSIKKTKSSTKYNKNESEK